MGTEQFGVRFSVTNLCVSWRYELPQTRLILGPSGAALSGLVRPMDISLEETSVDSLRYSLEQEMLVELNRDRGLGPVYGSHIFVVHVVHEMISAVLQTP